MDFDINDEFIKTAVVSNDIKTIGLTLSFILRAIWYSILTRNAFSVDRMGCKSGSPSYLMFLILLLTLSGVRNLKSLDISKPLLLGVTVGSGSLSVTYKKK